MIVNPFEELVARLERIENLLTSTSSSEAIPHIAEKPISSKELCEFLNISEPTLIRWRKKAKIPYIQVGNTIRFDKAAVVKALEKNSRK